MSDNNTPETETPDVEATGKKGKPTPKRKDQEAARKRPVIADTKAAKKQQREQQRNVREKEWQALREGDERHMPLEHRGPERRYLRDYVDARTSPGEFLLPASIVFVIASLLVSTGIWGIVLIALFYFMVLVVGLETFLMIRRLKKRFIEKFGARRLPRGWTFYVIARHLNMRRFRTPKPKVKRGEYPV